MIDSKKSFQHQSKASALGEHLMEMARVLGPGAKLPTIQELRRDLQVSVATLDSALGQLESQKVILRKHGVGIFVSPHLHQKSIGLICEPAFFRAASPFWQRLIAEVSARATAKGDTFRFYLAIPSGREDVPVHDDLIEDVRARHIDGAFFIGHNKPAVFWLREQGVPVVSFAGWSECVVQLDYGELVRQALARLQVLGCQKVALMCAGDASMEKIESPLYSVWDATAISPSESADIGHEEHGFKGAMALFSDAKLRPDGLISADDMMTRGALRALDQLGLRAGQDVSIVSHANRGSDVLRGFEHELSLVEFDPAEVVQAMFEALEALMDGQSAPGEIWIKPHSGAQGAP